MAKKYRKCLLCEQEYLYCSGCSHDKTKPTWMAEFHEENCKNIFQTCTDFNMKFLTKDEAKKTLSKCDLTNKANFKPSVQNTIAIILAEPKKPAEEKIAPAPAVKKVAKAPVAPKAAKTPVVEKTEITPIIEKIETIPAPKKAEPAHEVVTETEEK